MSQPADAQPTRYRAIDGFRFMAAIGIVLLHYARYSEHDFWKAWLDRTYLFVDLFFIISGFVISAAYGRRLGTMAEYSAFLQNRLARIYPLHLAMLLAFFAMEFAAWSKLYQPHEPHIFDNAEYLTNLLLVQAWGVSPRVSFNYPSWSISAEWMMYLLFPAVGYLARRGGTRVLFGCAALAVVVLEVMVSMGHLPPWTTLTYDFGYLRAIPTFLVGAGLFWCVDYSARWFRSLLTSALFFLAAVVGIAFWLDDRLVILLFALTIAAATGAEKAGARGFLTGALMARLGDWSYAVYMIHVFFGSIIVANVGPRLLHLHGWVLDLYILACIACVVALSALVYRHFEVPARQLFRNRGARPVPFQATAPQVS